MASRPHSILGPSRGWTVPRPSLTSSLICSLLLLLLIASPANAQLIKGSKKGDSHLHHLHPPGPCQIILPEGENAATFLAQPWPGGIVPFEFDGNVSAQNRQRALDAMAEIENVSDVDFVPLAGHANWVHIQDHPSLNNSAVGMMGIGRQDINIHDWNVKFLIVHELLHTLGFWHEHQRPDRNTFVQINTPVIIPAFLGNFSTIAGAQTFGTYDFDSVMHYPQWAFSTCWPFSGCETITALFPNQAWQGLMGQMSHLSQRDIEGLCRVYGCRPANDECAGAQPLFLGVNTVDNRWTTNSPPAGCADQSDAWYYFDAVCTGQATLDIVAPSAGYQPTVSVYVACPPATQLACDTTAPISVAFNVNTGVRYHVRVGGAGGSTGTARLVLNCGPQVCFPGFLWTTASSSGPSLRYDHAMAYDPARQVTVLFGGRDTATFKNDTWEWNASTSTWNPRASSGPSARYGHTMTFDPVRQRVVLFGGRDAGGNRNDMYEWNGVAGAWTVVSQTNAPPVRYYSALVDHAASNRLLLFGGFGNAGALADTWEFNSSTGAWTQRFPAQSPSARFNHGMAYDSARSVTVLFAGGDSVNAFADTHEWNGNTWTLRANSGPGARRSLELAFSPLVSQTILFGGFGVGGNTSLSDTWAWNGLTATWTQLSTSGQDPRFGHAMTFDSAANVVVLHGGASDTALQPTTKHGAPGTPNDDSTQALTITHNSSTPIDLRCAANGPAGCASTADVWYKFVAGCTGQATVTVTGASFVPSIAVYLGNPPGTQLACVNGTSGTVVATAPVTAGQVYSVRVGAQGPGGVGTLHLQFCRPETCPPNIVIQAQTQRLYYVTGTASGLGWSWCAEWLTGIACDYNVAGVAAGGSAADLAQRWVDSINAHACTPARLRAQRLPAPRDNHFVLTLGGNQPFVNFRVGLPGQAPNCTLNPWRLCPFNADIREIQLSGNDCNGNGMDDTIDLLTGEAADINLSGIIDECELPANDRCNNPLRIAGQGTFNFDTILASTDGPAHVSCNFDDSDQIDRDLWYQWIPDATGLATLTTCDQTDTDTRIAAYITEDTVMGCPPLILLACNDDACDLQSTITWNVVEGSPYVLRIGVTPNTPGGPGSFTLSIGGPADCPADWDENGVVNASDVGAFLSDYLLDIAEGTLVTDFDHNGVVNAADVGAFLNTYFKDLGPCP